MFFLKPSSCLIGHGAPIIARPYYGGYHPEPELIVIIGRSGKDIARELAMDYVAGFSMLNDVIGDDMRAEDREHYHALYPSAFDPESLSDGNSIFPTGGGTRASMLWSERPMAHDEGRSARSP